MRLVKRKKRFAFFLLFFTLTTVVGTCEEKKLSLRDCTEMALKNSKKIASSKAGVFLAKANKNEALSTLLPQLSIDGKYEEKNTARDFSVFTEYGGAFSTQTVGLMANWLLFDFGGSYNQLRAEKKALLASEKILERTVQCIEEEVHVAYFHLLEALQTIPIIEESIQILNEQLKTSSDFFNQGLCSKSDPLFVKVDLEEKKKAHLRAKNEYSLALMNMNRLLGRDLLRPLSIDDLQNIPDISLPLETLQKLALQNRSDLKALKNQTSSLLAKKSASKAAYAPRFYAFGGYSYLRDSTSDQKNWISGGLGLQFSLYDGGKTSAATQKIRAHLQETQAHKEDLENQILLETNHLFLQLQEVIENISIDNASLELSQENIRTLTDRYKQGLVSVRDLLAAEKQLTSSRMNQMRTIYHAEMLYAKLLSTTGGF